MKSWTPTWNFFFESKHLFPIKIIIFPKSAITFFLICLKIPYLPVKKLFLKSRGEGYIFNKIYAPVYMFRYKHAYFILHNC